MSEENFKKNVYMKICEFLTAVNLKDLTVLAKVFFVSSTIFDEIQESLFEYFNEIPVLEIALLENIFLNNNFNRPYLDIYKMNAENTWGVECVLFVENKEQEPILHFEIKKFSE